MIFDRHNEKLRIINDRFTSYPVYFAELMETLFIKHVYRELALKLNEMGRLHGLTQGIATVYSAAETAWNKNARQLVGICLQRRSLKSRVIN